MVKQNKRVRKKWQDLTIQDDFMFSKVMQDEKICKEIVELLLDIKIDKIEYIQDQKVIDVVYEKKSIRMDIYMRVNDITYNVEMQSSNKNNNAKRTRYYQSMNDLHELEKGFDYNTLNDSYLLFICTFDPFGEGECVYNFENVCIRNRKKPIYLHDGMHKVFFNTTAYRKANRPLLKSFLKYVENGSVNEEDGFIQHLQEKVQEIKTSKRWEREYMTFELLQQDKFNEGIEKTKRENAIALLSLLDDEAISKAIGLPLEDVLNLRKMEKKNI